MTIIARRRLHTQSLIAQSSKPHALGAKTANNSFSILGFFKRAAGSILGGLKKVVVAAGNIAQEMLDILNTFILCWIRKRALLRFAWFSKILNKD